MDKLQIVFGKDAIKYSSQWKEIFKQNNQHHIANKKGIYNYKKHFMAVALLVNNVIGYQLYYIDGDFVRQEGFEEPFKNGLKYEDDALYVWDICTKKEFEHMGVQKALFAAAFKEYKDQNFYTITDSEHTPSVKLQEGVGFKPCGGFNGVFLGEAHNFTVYWHQKELKKQEEPGL